MSHDVDTDKTILEADHLYKHFGAGAVDKGKVQAVDGVSFRLFKGETLALVGESGCGKSTLGRLIMRFNEPTGGEVRFRGDNIFALRDEGLRRYRRQVQMVFQDPNTSLNPRLSVGRSIQRAWECNRDVLPKARWRERVGELLEMVGLSADREGFYPHQLSGGQRQRVSIARALALGPSLVICDEPVSALDVSVQAQVVALLQDLQEHLGVSYLFISHDLDLVHRISQRVMVMYLGRIVETGDAETVFKNPAHPYTRAMADAIPVPDPTNRTLLSRELVQGDPPSPYNPPSGCRFRTRCPIARDVCAEVDPQLLSAEEDAHKAACHFPLTLSQGAQGASRIARQKG